MAEIQVVDTVNGIPVAASSVTWAGSTAHEQAITLRDPASGVGASVSPPGTAGSAALAVQRADGTPLAADGTDASGVSAPSGATGIRGWLSGIYSLLNAALKVTVQNFPATQPVSGSVSVSNFPSTQPVSGTVGVSGNVVVEQSTSGALHATIDNFPATQPVSGTVAVSNLPATQPVSGSVSVSNFPATQPVSGTVSVGNFPATQPVSGTVSVGNFPATQPVSGTVSVSNPEGPGVNSSGTGQFVPVADSTVELNVTTATTTALISGTSGKTVYVCGFDFIADGTGTVQFVHGTSNTPITGPYAVTAQTGVSRGSGYSCIWPGIPAGDGISVITTGSATVQGSLCYTQH